MLLYLPVYPISVIATSTAPCLSLPQGHKSERVSFQFRTGRMIVLKKEGQRLLKKKTKKPLWKENPFLEGQEGRTLWHYKIKTDGKPGQLHREMRPPTLEDSSQQLVMPPFAYSFHTHLTSAVSKPRSFSGAQWMLSGWTRYLFLYSKCLAHWCLIKLFFSLRDKT